MDIFYLLKTGKLNGIHLNAKQSSVISTMSNISSSKKVDILEINGVVVALCEGIEAHFVNGHMNNFIIKLAHYWGRSSLNVGSPQRRIYRRTSLGRTIKFLHELEIEWKFFQKYCVDQRVELITEGDVSLEFLADAGYIMINRIHLTEGEFYSGIEG